MNLNGIFDHHLDGVPITGQGDDPVLAVQESLHKEWLSAKIREYQKNPGLLDPFDLDHFSVAMGLPG